MYVAAAVISAMVLFTNLFIAHVRFLFGEFYYNSPGAPLYWLYIIFFMGLIIYSHILLYFRLRDSSTPDIEKHQIQYFFLAAAIGFSGASMCFLPVYYIDVYPITNFFVVAYPIIMGYAIFRYKLFDIHVAAAQGLIFLLWVFVGVRLVFSSSIQDFLLNGILFVAVIVAGIFLVRSVNNEIKQRERSE